MHCLTFFLSFIFLHNRLTFSSRVISSDSKECDPRTPRCLPPSSNLLKRAKTREINTWYPIPRHRILFDTRKNSRGGRFASNFNKPSPTRADGYPHANDFPRSLKKGKIAEEFGIRFGSLTGDQSRMEAERLAKLNDTAGGEEALFVLSNARPKSSGVPGLEGGYHVNNSSTKVNSTRKNDGTELFENLEIQLSDTVSSNTSNVSDSSMEFLNEPFVKNVSANASLPLVAAHNSRTIKIAINSETKLDFSIANLTEVHENEFQNNVVTPFPSTENFTVNDLNSNEEIESNENYSSKVIDLKCGTIANIANFRAIEIDGIEIPIIVATLHLKIKDKNRTEQNRDRQQQELIISRATDSLKDSAFQDRRKRRNNNLKNYTVQSRREKLKYFNENYSNLSTEKNISTKVLKIFNMRNIPKLNSGKIRVEIRNRNKRAARAGISLEMQKFYQRNGGADLSNEGSTIFRISDNAPVVVESYQTGTFVRGRVPLLSNELPRKNNSVSDEGRKKSELQIYKEDSFDKDLGASKMETGIGDQLRNDVKEGESKGGRYIYIRLRNLHSSLRESGNKKIQRISEETSFESSGGSDLRKRVLRMYKPNGFATVSLRSNNETIKRVVNDEWKMRRSIIRKAGIKGNNEVDNENFTPLGYLLKENGHFENNKRYPLQKLKGNYGFFDHDSDYQLNESTNFNKFNFNDMIYRSVNKTRIENNVTENIGESIKVNGSSKQNTLLYLIRNVNAVGMIRQKRQLRAENKETFTADDIHTFHRQNGVNLGHILGFLIHKPISTIKIGAKKGEVSRNRGPVQSSLLRSNVYVFEGSPSRLLNSFDSNINSDNRGNHLPINKIRDLFRFAGRRADRFNRWRIIGRAATPKRNLTFSSYSQSSARQNSENSRPSTRLKEWIRAAIYKEKVSLRTPKTVRNAPDIQEEDPKVLFLLILPSDERSVSESADLNDRTAFPNRETKNSQIETEEYDELFIKQTSNKTYEATNVTVSEDSVFKPQPRNVKGRNKPNIGEKYARFVNDENSDRDTENESRSSIQDWLNSQWIYINSINTTDNLSTITEIPNFRTTEVIPSYTSVPENTTASVSNRAAQTRAPIRKTTSILSTRAPNTRNTTENPNGTDTTKKPESIQNMPTTVKPWSNPHYPWERPWYNPWEETKTHWDHPVNSWQITQKPWSPPVTTWETRKPWVTPVDPWETAKKPWVPPVNPWQATRKPRVPPVDPWKKTKTPWNPPDNIWKVTEKPWIPPVDPWEKTKRPWNPPINPWEKKLPWNPPKDLWQENKRPRNKPINVWQITQKPWIPPNTAWHVTERPWTPPYDPWHLVERPGNPPDQLWRMLPKPWNQPDNPRKATRPWNPPDPWKINNRPSNPPSNPKLINNRGLSSDSWKMNIPWWDCSEWLLPYEAWRI